MTERTRTQPRITATVVVMLLGFGAAGIFLGFAIGTAIGDALTDAEHREQAQAARATARSCARKTKAAVDRENRDTNTACARSCWELIQSDVCRHPAEPDPFTPVGGWCAEAERWCALYGARSRSCSDARVRCRLYVRDAGPPE